METEADGVMATGVKTTIVNCKVCGDSGEKEIFAVKEMMFGLRDTFEYLLCRECDSLQLNNIPDNMQKYYPEAYYSFEKLGALMREKDDPIRRYLRHRRSSYHMNGKSVIGYLANILRPIGGGSYVQLSWLKECRATFRSKILDVGCGRGELLKNLEWLGFRDLTGIDPYIKKDIVYSKRVKIMKKKLGDIDMRFDIIMMHHSLEHIDNPQQVFKDISRLLNKDGCVLIRIPVVPSYAWEHYRTSWVALDAPRHFFAFSLKGIGILAEKTSLKMKKVVFDSDEFQFIGSEQYMKDIPLNDQKSYFVDPERSIFSKNDIEKFKTKAMELNRQNLGDQVAVYLIRE